jgi:oligoribonuclease
MRDDTNLIWIDLEMTGLNPFTEEILELATIITNSQLDVLAEGPVLVLHHPEKVLEGMDAWNAKHHQESGLLDLVRRSTCTCRQAELATLNFVRQWVGRRKSPMCGNSIWHDRHFLARCMPELEGYFHYRNIDVSTLKELARLWAPDLITRFPKQCRHLALEDIRESIAELRHYRECWLRR